MTNSAEKAKAAEERERKDSVLREGDAEHWALYVDVASNDNGSGVGMMLISPEGHKIHYAICFGFNASNNETEYKALIAGLHLARELQAHNMKIFSNSQLVVNQVNDIYLMREEKMAAYLEKGNEQLSSFSTASIEVILQSKNSMLTH